MTTTRLGHALNADRQRLEMTQIEYAKHRGIPLRTLQDLVYRSHSSSGIRLLTAVLEELNDLKDYSDSAR